MPEIVTPVIPETVTVHLGAPDAPAQNITVPFTDYIKNVASSEIYPNWPESALRANIYAITSFVLNRIYTEWYPSRGYNFDITNTTAYDQAFRPNRQIYDTVSDIVDEMFDEYIVREGNIEPLFASFCNGTTSTCSGLSQWGTVELANMGLTPFEILQRYYGYDINIMRDTPVESVGESYPGSPLRLGDSGNSVKIIQTELNRIARNYPAIPKIAQENGNFGVDTENAVRKFQEVFSLPQTGEVDKTTWYRIRQYYNGVKRLAELTSEGVSLTEALLPFIGEFTAGIQGNEVRGIQYYLNILAYFNPTIPQVTINGIYDPATIQAVEAFQSFYGLPVTGIVDADTWNMMQRIYRENIDTLPPGYQGNFAKLYPGFVITPGMEGQSVTDIQTYLSLIGRTYRELPEIPITGFYGDQTRDAVYTFQRLFGLPETGAVSAATWYAIAREYDALVSGM